MTPRDDAVWEFVLTPMTRVCRKPSGVESKDALSVYCQALRRFTDNQLQIGWAKVAPLHVGKFWPGVRELEDACRTVPATRNTVGGDSLPGYVFKRVHEIETQYERQYAERYATADIEGWLFDLKGVVRERATAVAVAEFRHDNSTPSYITVTDDDVEKFRHRVASRNAYYERTANPEQRQSAKRLGDVLARVMPKGTA